MLFHFALAFDFFLPPAAVTGSAWDLSFDLMTEVEADEDDDEDIVYFMCKR